MKRLWRVGAFGWFGVALLVPVVLAQVAEQHLGLEIGKASSAEAQMEIARGKHFTERDYPGAIEAYDDVVNLFPTSDEAPEALFRIGNIHHWRLTDPDEAITSYRRVVDAYPESDFAREAWIRIGEAYGRHDRWQEALSRFATWAFLKIGHTHYIDLQDRESGRPFLERAVAEHPGTVHAAEAQLRLTRMAYEDKLLTPDQALQAFRGVEAGAGDDPVLQSDALHMVAMVLTVERRYRESLVILDRIINGYEGLSEDSLAIAYRLKSLCYQGLGQRDLATTTAERALAAFPATRWRGRLQSQLSWLRKGQMQEMSPNE